MTVSLSPSALTLNLHAMPCTNACAHRWVQGSARKPRMPFEQIAWVLEQLAGLKGQGIAPGFFLFDELTHHPRFLDILQRAADLDLLPEGFFVVPTAASWPIDRMRIGRRCGRPATSLQLTLYGLEATHDVFAGRTGAFRDVVTMARRGLAHGMELVIQVIWHADNTAELARRWTSPAALTFWDDASRLLRVCLAGPWSPGTAAAACRLCPAPRRP